MTIKNYKDLYVWQEGRALVKSVYLITALFPDDERYGLCSQLRRAVVSIPSNIAEGHSRSSTKDYVHFVSIAIGSLAEVETQLILAYDLSYISEESLNAVCKDIARLQRMLHSLRNSLKKDVRTVNPSIPNPHSLASINA